MDETHAAAVAAAGLGAMYYVVGHNPSDLWGVTREAFALKAAASNVGNGPATDLLTVATREVTEHRAGTAAVDLKDKASLRGLGLEQSAGPYLSSERCLPTEPSRCGPGPRHRRRRRQASHDAGATEEVSVAEHRALDAIAGVLDA